MIALLLQLVTEVGFLPEAIAAGGVLVINLAVAALGAVLAEVVSLFPSLPAAPAPPEYLRELNWLVPLGGILAEFTAFLAAWVAFLAIRTIARWVKAL